MGATNPLSDGGLQIGTIKINLGGYPYVFVQATYDKPISSTFERDENGKPTTGYHNIEPEKISGEIKAYNGVPEPSQLIPFTYVHRDGVTRKWAVGNLKFNYSNSVVTSYSCDLIPIYN